jgi:hypothetical protein
MMDEDPWDRILPLILLFVVNVALILLAQK